MQTTSTTFHTKTKYQLPSSIPVQDVAMAIPKKSPNLLPGEDENTKYRLTHEEWFYNGRNLHRIKALRSFGNVQAGDLGGWVESMDNLSHEGNCWIFDNSKVYGKACLRGNDELHNEQELTTFQ